VEKQPPAKLLPEVEQPKKLPCGVSIVQDVKLMPSPPQNVFIEAEPGEDGGSCLKCGLWVSKNTARKRGKQSPSWICRTCHSKYTSLQDLRQVAAREVPNYVNERSTSILAKDCQGAWSKRSGGRCLRNDCDRQSGPARQQNDGKIPTTVGVQEAGV
jgi:hypothetical protein